MQELQRSGGVVHLPYINNSDSIVNITGVDVYLCFIGIHGLKEAFIELIPEERRKNGDYAYSLRCTPFYREKQKGIVMGDPSVSGR